MWKLYIFGKIFAGGCNQVLKKSATFYKNKQRY